MYFCKACKTEKDITEFYKGSKSKCKECKKAQARVNSVGRVHKHHKNHSIKKYPILICEHCGEDFKNPGGARKKFCSKKCQAESHIVKLNCEFCGCDFELIKSQISNYKRTCSLKCRGQLKSKESGVFAREFIRKLSAFVRRKEKERLKPYRRGLAYLRYRVKYASMTDLERKFNNIAIANRNRTAGNKRGKRAKITTLEGGIRRALDKVRNRIRWLSFHWVKRWSVNCASNNRKRMRKKENARAKREGLGENVLQPDGQMQFDWS